MKITSQTTLAELAEYANSLGIQFVTVKMKGRFGVLAGIQTDDEPYLMGNGDDIAEALEEAFAKRRAIWLRAKLKPTTP